MSENINTQPDLLDSFENNLVRASTGQRLANYIVDIIVFYILAIGVGIIMAIISPETIYSISNSPGIGLVDRLISLVMYAVYMGIVEALFKGKSLGKLITGTRAVNLDGSAISAGTAFTRGFSRAVPFCVFSAFGTPCNPWQDRWTDTMVIDEKQSRL